ncbi:hypothetical protein NE235_24235 [Actinoallomurus spadix]|uniref:DUF5678 domain-containing protein n=1 Tax=Actinoallomurus spadix TaxID=79912 RepID=A0ABP3G1C8_9ACTN|nr:hypothetical protein [Actinoallomurus spadix]MCO5989218.1 hypothetical protein [Actinoallomurus spadix]
MADFAATKATLESKFPGWIVWRSDAGHWYATRAGSLTDQQIRAGQAMTVAAEAPETLRLLLAEQERPGEGAG